MKDMVRLTQKRITKRFTLILLLFTVLILSINFVYFHQSIMNAVKRHLREEIQVEFIDQFHRSGLDTFKAIWDEYHFQILNRNGDVVIESRSANNFYPPPKKQLLTKAFAGEEVFKVNIIKNKPYLVAYFVLSDEYSGRIAASLNTQLQYERNFLNLLLMTLPGMLLLSYFFSRYLVKQAMNPISEAFTFQKLFSSSVSHELRSPLTSLKGNLEVALRKERSPEEYREAIGFGLTEVNRIISLLNDLHLLASSRVKPLDLFKKEVDIKIMIEELVDANESRIHSKRIRIDNSINTSSICSCDEALIRRVFENILTNAVNYTPEGGSITVSAFRASGKIHITVANTCEGISGKEIDYFFEPFYRGKSVAQKNFEGKGLGLFIARYIVRSHGGEITAKVTGDTLFSVTVSLPIK